MPDICKCTGVDCPFKNDCYRYTSKADKYQTYFVNPPIKDGKCDHYWGENGQYIWSNVSQKEQQ